MDFVKDLYFEEDEQSPNQKIAGGNREILKQTI